MPGFAKCGVIVTGLPASGKTTVARELAERLSFAFLDKDAFLEALFERSDVRSMQERNHLSRQSDDDFRNAAIRLKSAVLVSHWRSLGSIDESGTPSDWLTEEFDRLVEVYCDCSPKVAQARFLARKRHLGHLDRHIDANILKQKMDSWARRFPLGIGILVKIRTDGPVNSNDLIAKIQRALSVNQ